MPTVSGKKSAASGAKSSKTPTKTVAKGSASTGARSPTANKKATGTKTMKKK